MPRPLLLLLSALLLCLSACHKQATTLPNRDPIAIVVIPDRNLAPHLPPERIDQLNQLGTWMEGDLVSMLTRNGYQALRSEDPSAQAGPGRYLLRVKITNYSAGSKVARALVGFGAGMARLDTHFELVGEGGAVLEAGDPSVASSRDWTNAARRVNVQTLDAISARIASLH